VHIIVIGKLPPGRRQLEFGDRPHHGVGLYDCDSPRYFTVTGKALNGNSIAECTEQLARIHARLFSPKAKPRPAPHPARKPPSEGGAGLLLDDEQLIQLAFGAKNGAKFWALWQGDDTGYGSASQADQALCNILAFYTACDAARLERLFRESGLMREKWNREDYRERTIDKAIALTGETYSAGANSPKTVVEAKCNILMAA
jgi:primase-polymerase (primpol)-like protein